MAAVYKDTVVPSEDTKDESKNPEHEKLTITTDSAPQAQVIDQRYIDIPAREGDWSTGLMQCTMDIKICFLSFLCPFCYGMKLSTEMGESIITPCLVPNWFSGLRQKMRLQQGIPGTLLGDCAMEVFCSCCALGQLAREIKIRQAHGQLVDGEPRRQAMARS